MKKIFSLIFGIVMCLSVMLISFLPVKNLEKNQTYASESIEQNFYDGSTKELVVKNPTSLIGASTDKTPFDEEKKQRMEGFSITPTADEFGQVSYYSQTIAGGAGYMPEVSDNILMWVYLIDAIAFKLEISLTNSSSENALTWSFGAQQVYEMGSGWKLIALKLSDFQDEIIETPQSYSLITFKYLSEASEFEGEEGYESYDVVTNERFSFYHIFTSKNAKYIEKSGIILSLSKSFYKFSENFSLGNDVFVGDKIKVESPSKMFDYFIVGKNDLSDYLDSGEYFWNLSIKNPSSYTSSLDFGDTINFTEKGFYYLKIQLFEDKALDDESVFYTGINIHCDELYLGRFKMGSDYKIVDDEKILISFQVSSGLTDVGEYSVSLSNSNAEIETYYEEDGVLYVCVVGKSDGRVELEITAEAQSKHNKKVQTFSSIATIDVDYTKDDVDIFMVILWITFGLFCLSIIIYMSISVVKARKNDVK